MKAIATFLFVLLIVLQVKLWFGDHGLFRLWSLRGAIDNQQQQNKDLMQRNEKLHAEVQELKAGKEALEERARSQLGFIREGETFYRVLPNTDNEKD